MKQFAFKEPERVVTKVNRCPGSCFPSQLCDPLSNCSPVSPGVTNTDLILCHAHYHVIKGISEQALPLVETNETTGAETVQVQEFFLCHLKVYFIIITIIYVLIFG